MVSMDPTGPLRRRAGLAFALSFVFAAPAAGSSLVATPSIETLSGQSVRCDVVNASPTKAVTLNITVRDQFNAVRGPSMTRAFGPLEASFFTGAPGAPAIASSKS